VRKRLALGLVLVVAIATACSSGSKASSKPSSSTSTAATTSAATTTTLAVRNGPCGNGATRPERYSSVIVFSFENRTWAAVGGAGFTAMPYLHSLATQCAYFTDWTETDTGQNSLSQYVGQVTGTRQPGTVNDCNPSATCSTKADSIFRQARTAGLVAVNYVEGATTPCRADGNAAKHIPALFLWGADDRAHCDAQVRPLPDLDVNALPAFAFVTPTLCNDGHDCPNATVDAWARKHIAPVIASAAYRTGKVAVFVWYDEDHPVPNLWITPSSKPGPQPLAGAGFAGTLAAWESMLGLPCLANACRAPDMRAAANG
jgi:phosphatidylinositol-3-phosphatase